jgi:hypothetical protein
MKYKAFSYIYPPRPANAIPIDNLPEYDNGSFLAQPKLNGSNCVFFMNETQLFVMNRHAQRLTNFRIPTDEIRSLYSGSGWMVLNGEYLNKSKNDEAGQVFNHKLVIFDLLVYNSEYLVGSTFSDRVEMLDNLFSTKQYEKEYLYAISENVFRVKSYDQEFDTLFENITRRGTLIEGVVMKRKKARLEIGNSPNNNSKSQVKCRVATKNYKF